MREFFESISIIAEKIKNIEKERQNLANFLKECNLTKKIKKNSLENLRIVAVDGGLVKRSFHGLDIILTKACGVLYEYKNGKLVKVDYYPSANPSPIPEISFNPFSDLEFLWKSGFVRQMTEIKTAIETIKNWKPDLLLLDGSIIPHYSEVPRGNSILSIEYQRLIEAYKNLFKNVGNTLLAGIIKDSRGTRFCDEVRKKVKIPKEFKLILSKTKDSDLLFHILELNERSFTFDYSSSPDFHPILRNFPEFANKIHGFYLRTAEFDRPIRVDFLSSSPEEDADKISSFLLPMCQHSSYGIPSILIEADQRAKLKEGILDLLYQELVGKTGNVSSLFQLRGKQRPFR
jgi:hypothetical protein